jgi:hypothetical protein
VCVLGFQSFKVFFRCFDVIARVCVQSLFTAEVLIGKLRRHRFAAAASLFWRRSQLAGSLIVSVYACFLKCVSKNE